jgi:hypothetical protein
VFQTYVSSVSSGCCIRCYGYTCIFQVFQMFQTYVASASVCCKSRSGCCIYIAMTIHTRFKCFICFRCKLQMFHLDISKVDPVLYMFAMALVTSGQQPVTGLRLLPRAFLACCASPSPLLFLAFPLSRRGSSSSTGKPYPTSERTPAEMAASGRPTAARCLRGGPVTN